MAAQVGQLVGHDRGRGPAVSQGGRIDQNRARRHAPAERPVDAVAGHQLGPVDLRQVLDRRQPGLAGDGRALPGPAGQGAQAQHQPAGHQHHAEQPQCAEGLARRRPGPAARRRLAGRQLTARGDRDRRFDRQRRQQRQVDVRQQGGDHRQAQQDADRGPQHVHALDGAQTQEAGAGQTRPGHDAGLDQQGDQQGPAHGLRSTAASIIRSRAAASSSVRRWPMPSRAEAALAAEPAKKVSMTRRSAPAATASVSWAGR